MTGRKDRPTGVLPGTSLIICTRNRPELLLETVESVLKGHAVPAEIIIIDQSDHQHPSLAVPMTARGCDIRYTWMHAVGVSRARNAGVRAARCNLLVFIDDDISVTPGWLGCIVMSLKEAGPKTVVSGQVLAGSGGMVGTFVPSLTFEEHQKLYEGRVGRDVLWTGNMAASRCVFQVVGEFDERLGPGASFPSAEDNDFGLRLLEAGFRVLYVPSAVVMHRAWRTEKQYLPLRWSYGLGSGGFYAKHLSLRDGYMLRRFLRDVRDHIFITPARLRRDRRKALGDVVLALGLLAGAARWMCTERLRGR